MKKAIIFLGILVSSFSYSQATNGMSGLIHIPSARMLEDGQLVLGAAYIPSGYFSRTYGSGRGVIKINPGLNTYITYGILPFVEVMFRYSHELNMPVNVETRYFPDRMLGIKARLLSEKKYIPAVVLGLQDASSIIGGTCTSCSNYSATYFVGSKNFKTDFGEFDLSIGFAFDFLELKSRDYELVFGGISFNPNLFKNLSILFEHNSKGINTGISMIFLSKFNMMLGVWNLDKPTFSFNYLL
jgi:hypothetical protein